MNLFCKNSKDRVKLRRRFKIRRMVINSIKDKFVIYVFRSVKHIYASLIKDGKVVVHVDTVKVSRESENKGKFRRDLIPVVAKHFVEKLNKFNAKIGIENIIFDLSYYRYAGCVKLLVDSIKQVLSGDNITATTKKEVKVKSVSKTNSQTKSKSDTKSDDKSKSDKKISKTTNTSKKA